MRRIRLALGLAVTLLFAVLPLTSVYAASLDCNVCIVEIQTQGLSGASEEYIVLANNGSTAYNLAAHTLRYVTASGKSSSEIAKLSGILAPGSSIAFVSDSLKQANTSANAIPVGVGLADAGGSLQVLKNGSTVIDQVGWGDSSVSYREGTSAPVHPRGWSITRKQDALGKFQDSNDNKSDFVLAAHSCQGVSFNEIQPALINSDGNDLTQAIELLKASEEAGSQDCTAAINGAVVKISAGDIKPGLGLVVIDTVLDVTNQEVPLGLHTDAANTLQLLPKNSLANIVLPGTVLTQPVLLSGQSYAKFSTGFKATYQPTIGAANQLRTTPLASVNSVPLEPTRCEGIIINELLPNPLGDDSGQEWVEFANTTSHVLPLSGCVLQVGSTQYVFGSDQFIDAGQFLVIGSFSDGSTTHTLSLRNSDTNTVSLGHINAADSFEPSQTIQYSDAPEGQSWARFDDGWRWIQPTPGTENRIFPLSATVDSVATEFPAPAEPVPTANATQPPIIPGLELNITELLPNPAAPATDDADEYVELYNPNDQTVNLQNYKLKSGTSYSYSYTFGNVTLGSHQYAAFYARDTGLVLANSGGRVELLNPASQIISETEPYAIALEGQTWALIAGTWQWTITPTPGAANVASIPLLTNPVNPKSKSAATTSKPAIAPPNTKAPAAKTTTTKPTAIKAAKTPKTPKTPAVTGRQSYKQPAANPPSLHTWILVGLGASTLLYAAYEYRHDMVNAFRRLRRYREVRRATRAQA